MKKFITFLIATSMVFCLAASSEKSAEAQYILYGNKCCDIDGYRRCLLDGYYQVGSYCYCAYQGSGWTCR